MLVHHYEDKSGEDQQPTINKKYPDVQLTGCNHVLGGRRFRQLYYRGSVDSSAPLGCSLEVGIKSISSDQGGR